MRDVELYRHLLGLEEPWTVRSVELKVAEQRVDVWAGHAEGVRWPCPECGTELGLYDHAEERVWRHLDSCQFMTYLHAPPPRVECPTHGVRQVRLPWAEARARFTTLFERRRSMSSRRPIFGAPPGFCASVGTRPGTSSSGRSSAGSAPSSPA